MFASWKGRHGNRKDFLRWQRMSWSDASQTRKAKVCCEPLKTVECKEGSFPTPSVGNSGAQRDAALLTPGFGAF